MLADDRMELSAFLQKTLQGERQLKVTSIDRASHCALFTVIVTSVSPHGDSIYHHRNLMNEAASYQPSGYAHDEEKQR